MTTQMVETAHGLKAVVPKAQYEESSGSSKGAIGKVVARAFSPPRLTHNLKPFRPGKLTLKKPASSLGSSSEVVIRRRNCSTESSHTDTPSPRKQESKSSSSLSERLRKSPSAHHFHVGRFAAPTASSKSREMQARRSVAPPSPPPSVPVITSRSLRSNERETPRGLGTVLGMHSKEESSLPAQSVTERGSALLKPPPQPEVDEKRGGSVVPIEDRDSEKAMRARVMREIERSKTMKEELAPDLKAQSTQSDPLSVDEVDREIDLRSNRSTAEAADEPDPSPTNEEDDDSDEKELEPLTLERKNSIYQQFPGIVDSKGLRYSYAVTRMMAQVLRESRDGLPSSMEAPDLLIQAEEPSSEIHIAPAPSIRVDTINNHILNELFPQSRTEMETERMEIWLDDETMMKIDPVHPSGEEIDRYAFCQEDIDRVKRIDFFKSDLRDEQLFALNRFQKVESLSLSVSPHLTDGAIGAICKFPPLRFLQISWCPNITAKGIESLTALCMDQLEDFRLTTKHEIFASELLRKLATAPLLQSVSFSLCENLTPEALLCFRDVPDGKTFTISIKGCANIDGATLEALNLGRTVPIVVRLGKADQEDRRQIGFLRQAAPPPELPVADDLFSAAAIQTLFGDQGLPQPDKKDPDSIKNQFDQKRIEGALHRFRRFDLTGEGILDDHMMAFSNSFNAGEIPIETIRVWNCPQLSVSGIPPLRHFSKVKTLQIGQCPKVPFKGVEQLFIATKNGSPLPELEELYLAGMAVSNRALELMAKLPKIQRVNVSFCEDITWQGLKHLIETPSLKSLSLMGCSRIDPFAIREFQTARPDVAIEADEYIPDSTTHDLAIQEATRILNWSKESKRYVFIVDVLQDQKHPLPENYFVDFNKYVVDHGAVSRFYTSELFRYGFELSALGIKEMKCEYWLFADLVLQSLKNILRTRDAVVNHLTEVGFFTDQDENRAPSTTSEFIQFLHRSAPPPIDLSLIDLDVLSEVYSAQKQHKETMNPSPTHKAQALTFAGLGLTHLPDFVLTPIWDQVRRVSLEGNPLLERLPEQLLRNLPKFTPKELEELAPEEDQIFTPWRSQNEIYLAGFPVTDRLLERLAGMRKEGKVDLNLSHCEGMTRVGLHHLISDPALRSLNLVGCSQLDQFDIEDFRIKRPDVTLTTDQTLDPFILNFAIDEANQAMTNPKKAKEYRFLASFLGTNEPLTESTLPQLDETRVSQFYEELLKKFGISLETLQIQIPLKRNNWMSIELLLQSARNFSRIAPVISKGLRSSLAPLNLPQLLANLNASNPIEELDLQGLEMTDIPRVFYHEFKWPSLKTIKAEGNFFDRLPEGFKPQCPQLGHAYFRNNHVSEFQVLVSPRTFQAQERQIVPSTASSKRSGIGGWLNLTWPSWLVKKR